MSFAFNRKLRVKKKICTVLRPIAFCFIIIIGGRLVWNLKKSGVGGGKPPQKGRCGAERVAFLLSAPVHPKKGTKGGCWGSWRAGRHSRFIRGQVVSGGYKGGASGE